MAYNSDAVTEAAAKKLARELEILFKAAQKALEKSRAYTAEMMTSAAKKRLERKTMEQLGLTREFIKYVQHGGNMKSITVSDSDYLDFSRELAKRSVPFLAYDVLEDNAKRISYREDDAEKVALAVQNFKDARHMITEMTPKAFEQKFAGVQTAQIDGVGMVELELIRHYAMEQNLQFAAIQTGPDKCAVKICTNDKDKLNECLIDTAWDLTGDRGALMRKMIEYRLAGRETLNNLTPDAAKKEFFIVSKEQPNQYLELTSDDFKLYKEGKVVETVTRTEPGFYDRAFEAVRGLSSPVALEKAEWESDEMKEIVETRQTVIPTSISAADDILIKEEKARKERAEKERKAHELYEMKMSLDNSYSAYMSNDLTDLTVSWDQFFAVECINDEHDDAEAAGYTHAGQAATFLENQKYKLDNGTELAAPKRSQPTKADKDEQSL